MKRTKAVLFLVIAIAAWLGLTSCEIQSQSELSKKKAEKVVIEQAERMNQLERVQ